jgi:hypothetical protein
VGKSCIDYIRSRYKVPAKVGHLVKYKGQLYRIAWAKDGALVLRSEIYVHPTDSNLDYMVD